MRAAAQASAPAYDRAALATPLPPTHTCIHTQVVVAQGVLQRASAELTIKDASAIADNTLEYSVRSVLWALDAPELLCASEGAAGGPGGAGEEGEGCVLRLAGVTAGCLDGAGLASVLRRCAQHQPLASCSGAAVLAPFAHPP